ncbi:ABC transporter ATP-binding protein [Nitrincola tibetensis]|uniref:ABC transporter ATP-binding protein n=1 Tax=Nitrincola tibetensis TaxID=2219697 RepID=A0A364NJJ3_9GAMM|nr:ABC transporter ATP-binding protein [Nitrincola tibetensis]RAU17201.1 ABC transporter ATP-binding protein [Nitrincola tibetensis]
MSQLEIRQLRKEWQETLAVKNISFEIAQGEFVALLGPSGCGKSTTLKMIAGLEHPSSGSISLNGQDITHLPPGKRGLAMVFQSYALFPHLSIAENIVFGLKARGVGALERDQRLKRVTDLVNLGDHLSKRPSQLSGGQCQRVALARAIIAEAPLCLMDEPLSNLDAKLRNEMRAELRALQQRLGMTVLYVTHDQVEAMSMADRILLLNQGEIAQCGTPNALYQTPASTFVARFIGNPPMNLINKGSFLLGIRPEHIHLATDGIAAEVIRCDYHGADTIIDISLPSLSHQTIKLRLPGHQLLAAGSALNINWRSQDQHVFCSTTGQRLSDYVLPTLTTHSLIQKEFHHDTQH